MGKFSCDKCDSTFRLRRTFNSHVCEADTVTVKLEPIDWQSEEVAEPDDLVTPNINDVIKSEPNEFLEISPDFQDPEIDEPYDMDVDADDLEIDPLRLQIKEELDKSDTEMEMVAQPTVADADDTAPQFKCSTCDDTFFSKSSLAKHISDEHEPPKPFSCRICKKRFLQKHYVTLHMRVHTGERPYKCTLCPKTYSHKTSFTIHMRIHNGERPYECDVCGKRCYDKSGLTSHMRSHTKETPFQCEICFRKFTHSKSLMVHKRNHTGEKPYVCQYCNKAFRHWHKHKIHTRLHTGERPYKCKVCGKGFPRNDEVNRHMKSHMGIKSFRCSICGVFCATQVSITGHINLHHSELKQGTPPPMTLVRDSGSGTLGSGLGVSPTIYKNVVKQSQAVASLMKTAVNKTPIATKQGTTKVIEITSPETPPILPKRKALPPRFAASRQREAAPETKPLNYKEFIEWQEKMLTNQGLVVKGLPPNKSPDKQPLPPPIINQKKPSFVPSIESKSANQAVNRSPQFLLVSQQAEDGTIQKILLPFNSSGSVPTGLLNPTSQPTTALANAGQNGQSLFMVTNGSQKMLLMAPQIASTGKPAANLVIKKEPGVEVDVSNETEKPKAECLNIKLEKVSAPSSPLSAKETKIFIKQEPED